MPNFSIDLDNIARTLSKRSFKLSDVQDKIEKVAFDVVRFKHGNPEHLWQVQDADDGAYIVALYEEEDEGKTVVASVSPWSVTSKHADLHIFYKGDYLCKIASTELGFVADDMNAVQRYLPKKLAQNKNLSSSLLQLLDENKLKSVLSKYPELA